MRAGVQWPTPQELKELCFGIVGKARAGVQWPTPQELKELCFGIVGKARVSGRLDKS